MQLQIGTRASVLLAITAAAIFVWMVFGQHATTTTAAQSYFVGGGPSLLDTSDLVVARLRLEAGSRTNWHSHSNGQILMAEEGSGRAQVRGEELVELVLGRPLYAGPNVVHWHGAAPDEHLVHLTFVSGETTWLEPVGEQTYLGR